MLTRTTTEQSDNSHIDAPHTSPHPDTYDSSTGHTMSGHDWLDVHFAAARPEYEAQLRAAGIQPGWRVLDAACGSGSFLPWIAHITGPEGRISALDLDPDNVEQVNRRLDEWDLPCPVETCLDTVLDLPYPDDTFDAVWFANTSQYLTDEELNTTLAEFRRVVRPGGLVALKESDTSMYRVHPGPPGLILRWFDAVAAAGIGQWVTGPRVPSLPGRLRRSGLIDVRQRTTLIERSFPLDPVVRATWWGLFRHLTALAPELDLPLADLEFLAGISDRGAFERFLDNPDCWLIEGNILTVGTVARDVEAAS